MKGRLSETEEQLMDIIWEGKEIFFKDIMDAYPDPKPANTTIATLLKRIQDKGFAGYNLFGNSRQYYPLIDKDAYFGSYLKNMVKSYFDNSALNFASFFTKSSGMSESELQELRDLVDKELKNKRL